jgi:hypothetical protein
VAWEKNGQVYESSHCYLLLEATRGARTVEMGCNIVDSLESATSTLANDDGNIRKTQGSFYHYVCV